MWVEKLQNVQSMMADYGQNPTKRDVVKLIKKVVVTILRQKGEILL